MKTNEELNALKSEINELNTKLAELTEDELEQVAGGLIPPYPPIAVVLKKILIPREASFSSTDVNDVN